MYIVLFFCVYILIIPLIPMIILLFYQDELAEEETGWKMIPGDGLRKRFPQTRFPQTISCCRAIQLIHGNCSSGNPFCTESRGRSLPPPVNRKLPCSVETPDFPRIPGKFPIHTQFPVCALQWKLADFCDPQESFLFTPGVFLMFPIVSNGAVQWKLRRLLDPLEKFPIHTQILGDAFQWKLLYFLGSSRKVS